MDEIENFENNILNIKSKIDKFKPFSSVQLKNLQDWFKISFTMHSNAIEGNSFTQEEVKVLVEDGITVGGKTIRELKETQNLAELTDIIWKFFEKDFVLDEEFLFKIHKDLLNGIEKENLGKFRNIQVYILGSDEKLPTSKEVLGLMKNFLEDSNTKNTNILKTIAKIHYDFVKIHPFIDGNGRIARLLMNLFLVKNGFLPIIFPIITRLDYINSLSEKKKFNDFYKYFLWQTNENMNDYLRFFKD